MIEKSFGGGGGGGIQQSVYSTCGVFTCITIWILAFRYGLHLKVIHNDVTDRLDKLLKQCSYYLQQQQRPTESSIGINEIIVQDFMHSLQC